MNEPDVPHPPRRRVNHLAFATGVPAAIGSAGAALCILQFEQYGWSLFLILPLLTSFLAALFWSWGRKVSFWPAYGVALLSTVMLGFAIFLFALDGIVCMFMAWPLAAALALPAAAIGRICGQHAGLPGGPTIPLLLCLPFPFLAGFEERYAPAPSLRAVTTSVEIDAPIDEVWNTVIAFPKITAPPNGVFAFGIAYPIEAHIQGTGPGARRYCTFSTGSFIEPITTWEKPRLLAFDVIENPPPMKEFSIYHDLHAPHFEGHFISKRGQFRLTEARGKTRLEGTTWYTHTLEPQFYWGPISDRIIHQIHLRVLTHIQRQAEAEAESRR